jgi:hypothetical protein
MIAFADFKHTWIKIHARAASHFLALFKSSQTYKHDLGENLSAR